MTIDKLQEVISKSLAAARQCRLPTQRF